MPINNKPVKDTDLIKKIAKEKLQRGKQKNLTFARFSYVYYFAQLQ